jgi:putative ABC transport system permease protein
MLLLAWQTIRARPWAVAGALVALMLGVALVGAAGLVIAAQPPGEHVSRVRTDAVVVTAVAASGPVTARPEIPLSVLDMLARLPDVDSVVPEHAVDARLVVLGQAVDLPGTYPSGRGWSSASVGPYVLAAGAEPRRDDEVVLDARLAAAAAVTVGDDVSVLAEVTGVARYRVVGITALVSTTEAVVFFTDRQAGQLAGRRIDSAVLLPRAGQTDAVVAAVGRDPRLLARSGTAAHAAEPDPLADAYTGPAIVLGFVALVGAFVTVFVVSSTFALAVVQRRRELALIRLIGATTRQVGRMLRTEALLVAGVAAAAGVLLAVPVAHLVVAMLRHLDLAPPSLAPVITPWPFIVAAGLGFPVALLGVSAAAWRTRRVRPMEAVRLATYEPSSMTAWRWLFGLAALGAGIAAVPAAMSNPDQGYEVLLAFGLVVGANALAPAGIPMLGRVVAPLARRASAALEIAQASLRLHARRSAAVATPVLVLAGLVGALSASTFTIEESMAGELRYGTTADVIVVPTVAPGLAPAVLDDAVDMDVVAGVTPVATTQIYLAPSGRDRFTAYALPAGSFDGALRYRVRAGSLSDLRGDAFAVTSTVAAARGWRLGELVVMFLADGSEARLRLVAIVAGGGGFDSLPAFLLPTGRVSDHTGEWATTHALITLRPGADPGEAAAALSGRMAGKGAVAVTRDQWLERTLAQQFEGNHTFLLAILIMAAAYTTIAIANTVGMAVRERIPDLALARLAGASCRQAGRIVLWEHGIAATVALVLGFAVTATALATTTVAVRAINPSAGAAPPWLVLAAVSGGAMTVVLATTLVTAAIALRQRPLDSVV